MAKLDTRALFESIKTRTTAEIRQQFPFEGRTRRLELVDIKVEDQARLPADLHHTDNIEAQAHAKAKGRTWGVPVRATLRLVDKSTGKPVDQQSLVILRLPKITSRYSYIIAGQERQHDSLFRSKPRPYHRIANNGDIQARWNLARGLGFDITYEPKKGRFLMRFGTSNVPMHPILQALGVSDAKMRQTWGEAVFAANQRAGRRERDVTKAFTALRLMPPGQKRATHEQKVALLRKYFTEETEVWPDAMKSVFGKEYSNVNGENLLLSSKRLLKIQKGRSKDAPPIDERPDDRQSLSTKYLATTEDFIIESIRKQSRDLRRKVLSKIDREDARISDIISASLFNKVVHGVFDHAQRPDQTNPLQFLSGHMRTTIRGAAFGGVGSTRVNLDKDKQINPTHLGFLDPIQTPECWPGHAEVFTKEGWIRWDQTANDTEFLCRQEGKTFFQAAVRVHRGPYSGDLYCLEHGKISYEVTPNHRMWVDTVSGPSSWRFSTASRVHGKTRRFDTGHSPAEGELREFTLPVVPGNNSSKNVEEPIDIEDWAEFMGWFLSEGTVHYREDKSRYNVRIAQVAWKNLAEYEAIEALLDRLPFNWHWDGEGKSFGISTKQLAHYLRQFGKAHEKFIPDYFFDATTEAREALLEALLLGDGRIGSVRKDGRSYEQQVYTTTSPQLAIDVERLAVSLGYPTKISRYEDNREDRYLDVYEVRLLQHRYRTATPRHPNYPSRYHRKKYSGQVYCATVPGGLLYCRMPGKVGFWSGNSDETGIALHLPLGVQLTPAKQQKGKSRVSPGHELNTKVYDRKKKDWVLATPADLERENVAYPDQVKWTNGRPTPVSRDVVCYDSERGTSSRPWAQVRYILPSSKALLSFSANLIPFLGSNSGNRTMTGSKMQEQAVALKDREAPLVQTKTDGKMTFESALGTTSSHRSPVAGTITRVTKDAIFIRPSSGGKAVKVPIYNHFPLNGKKGMIHAEPVVKKGQKVKEGDLLADTSFTKGGTLAMGKNLRTAYIPWKGLTFEDSVVISESASKKLTSSHLHKESVTFYTGMLGGKPGSKAKWVDYALPERTTADKLAKLDDAGIVNVGTKVVDGDVLIAVLSPSQQTKEDAILKSIHRSLVRDYRDRSVVWHHDYPGTVVKVTRAGKKVTVHVKTEEPMTIGDKLAGRYGNKGVVGRVVPDKEMPRTKDGKPLDVLFNPATVVSRMNLGQVLETAASKIARKTGKPFVVENFAAGVDHTQQVKDALKKHGLSDTEEVIDPATGKPIGQVLTGEQYIMKLHHMVDKAMTARSYGTYTSSGAAPAGSGIPGGGQKMDALATYALLAHGAKHNLRDAQTIKSDGDQEEVWDAVMLGRPLPPPKPTRGMTNMLSYMRAMGIDTEKKGNNYVISPLTDKQALAISNGEIKMPHKALYAKGARTLEEARGLFDPRVTGGMDGPYWGHIKLQERMPNPMFQGAIQSLLGITDRQYKELVGPKLQKDGSSGFDVINQRLGAINVDRELAATQAQLPKLTESKLNKARKKVKYLQALKKLKVSPVDAYTSKVVPVIPPTMRKISIGLDGKQILDDLNGLYLSVGQANAALKNADPSTPRSELQKSKAHLYQATAGLRMTGTSIGGRHHRGLMERLIGKVQGVGQPKHSLFQSGVLGRRQDLSGRSVIIPEPDMGLDEVGIPIPMAMEMYRPFVVRELVREGTAPLDADKLIDKNDPRTLHALKRAVADRPVLMKRDPALHKFSVMGFKPKLVSGKSIQIHPLVTGGFNADFDGDKMGLFVPASEEAKDEAQKLLPSKNLFSPTHFGLMPTPSQDSLHGIYLSTKWGRPVTVPKGTTRQQAVTMLRKGELKPSDVITIDGKKTTPGRLELASRLPPAMRDDARLLYDKNFKLDKKGMKAFLTDVARKHPKQFGVAVNAWKDQGNRVSFTAGASFSLNDFHDGKRARDRILAKYKRKEAEIRSSRKSRRQKDKAIVALYAKAQAELKAAGMEMYGKSKNRVYEWAQSGGRGGWNQFGQMVFGPMLVTDPEKRPVPVPLTKSYGEGLPISQYMAAMHGARKGTLDRAAGTRDPGALTKDIINTVIDYKVSAEDCGSTRGTKMPTASVDTADRYLITPVKLKDGTTIQAGTLLTSPLLTRMRNSGVKEAHVRSPLHCKMSKGICQHCLGLSERGKHHDVGTNVGVISGHALGEPVTQLTMRCNAAGNLVRIRAGEDIFTCSLEQLWQSIPGTVRVDDDPGHTRIETKATPGLEVWDQTGWTRIRTIQRHQQDDEMYISRTSSGRAFVSQGNHPNWARQNAPACTSCGCEEPHKFNSRHQRRGEDMVTLRCVECDHRFTVRKGEYERGQERVVYTENLQGLLIGVSEAPKDTVPFELPMPPYLMGMWLAEGCFRHEKNKTLRLEEGTQRRVKRSHTNYRKLHSLIITQKPGVIHDQILQELDEAGISYHVSGKNIIFGDVELCQRLWGCGSKASEKQLPPGFLAMSKESIMEFLAGYYDGDGTCDPGETRFSFDTTSWTLASQVAELVRAIDGVASLYKTPWRGTSQNQGYRVNAALYEPLPSVKGHPLRTSLNSEFDDYEQVSAVQEVEYGGGFVYDIATETRAFSSNGVRTHNTFHTGGSVGNDGVVDAFQRVKQLFFVPKRLPGSAALATVSGQVSLVRQNPLGGYDVVIEGKTHRVIEGKVLPSIRKGVHVKKGDPLSSGSINPHELLQQTRSMGRVRDYLTTEVSKAYGGSVRRRHVETVVRAMTNLTMVNSAPPDSGLMRGQLTPLSRVKAYNEEAKAEGKPTILHTPQLRPMTEMPLAGKEDWMARLNYRRLKETYQEGAAQGWASDIHGDHPIPGLAHGAEFGLKPYEPPKVPGRR